MSEPKYVTGIDWGRGQDRAVGCVMKVEGDTIGIIETFELGDREVRRLEELDAPKDFIIPGRVTGSIPLERVWFNEEWLRRMRGEEEEPRRLNRAQRRKQRKKNT